MKKAIVLIILVMLIGMLSACMLSKDRIFEIVNNEQELLNKVVEEYPNVDYEKLEKLGIEYITDYPGGYLNFDCGNGYEEFTGFYYSESDKPIGWEGEDWELKEDGEGWSYTEWNSYYTERIKEHWFYYYESL